MGVNTHIRYTLTCDKCGSFYLGGEKFADSSALVFYARSDGWDISDNGHSWVYICPDCKGKEQEQ